MGADRWCWSAKPAAHEITTLLHCMCFLQAKKRPEVLAKQAERACSQLASMSALIEKLWSGYTSLQFEGGGEASSPKLQLYS